MNPSEIVAQPWVYGPVVAVGTVVLLFIAKRVVFRVVQRMAGQTATEMDDRLLWAAGGPLNLLIIASGLLLLGRLFPLTEEADRAIGVAYKGCVVAGMVWFMDRLGRTLIERYSRDVPFLAQGRPIIQGAVRALFFTIGLLILLDSTGISIAPLLASLGVGSLAVALALQGTLANLFAGMHLLADRVVEPGHWVQLESGQEGEVLKVGWRSTRIRTNANVMIVVPNAKLVESIIINLDVPDPTMTMQVPVTIHYDSDLAAAEQLMLETAREVVGEVKGAAPNPAPSVRVEQFAREGIVVTVSVTVDRPQDQVRVRHELLRRLHARLASKKIVIPYAGMPSNVTQERAAAEEESAERAEREAESQPT